METCIICVGEHPITHSNPLTIEHIVPENIGGCLTVKTVSQINLLEDGECQAVEVIVDKSEPHKAREMLKTKLRRKVKAEHGVSLTDEQLDELSDKILSSATVTTRRIDQPWLQMTHQIDEISTQLVYLKIGYELAVYHFGLEYLKDSQANLLQACLYTQHVPYTLQLSVPPLSSIWWFKWRTMSSCQV